jgi:hypothetical protein
MSADIKFYVSEDGPLSIIDPLSSNGVRFGNEKLDGVFPRLNTTGLTALELESIR